ncbi:MAG: biofilm regulation protein phosphatase SiaA [Halothiobacillaceae bacterium]
MAHWISSLRAKSVVIILLACLIAFLPATWIAQNVFEGFRDHFGASYAQHFTQLHSERITGIIDRELALTRRLADSLTVKEWLNSEEDKQLRRRALEEAERFREDFRGRSYTLASLASGAYYYNDDEEADSEEPRYFLDPDNPDDAWFYATLDAPATENLNPNFDRWLNKVMVWINVTIRDGETRLGIASTGLDLSEFIEAYVRVDEPGITAMILDEQGAFQAHPDAELIALGSGATGQADTSQTLAAQLSDPQDRTNLANTLKAARLDPGAVTLLTVWLDGREQLLALTHLEDLQWTLVTGVDLAAAHILKGGWLQAALAGLFVLVLLLAAGFAFLVDRLALKPLQTLNQAAKAIARGQYEVPLPPARGDEIGDLSESFSQMAQQVRSHTETLEEKVQERTRALSEANAEMARAHRKIEDSIEYASLIQRALLPRQQMEEHLAERHFVLWRPRDVVGGDFYFFREEGDRLLLGVVDCAGHGVPGALMTMLARAAFDDAMTRCGLDSPAAILQQADITLRNMIDLSALPRAIATNMDAGVVIVSRADGQLRFAGAKIALLYTDGDQVRSLPCAHRPLCHRRLVLFEDTELTLTPGMVYYLVSDGYLDQNGGPEGFGLGDSRFRDLILDVAGKPMHEQAATLESALDEYRGSHPQRDDVTVLAFHFD